jgi:hypothetical protein
MGLPGLTPGRIIAALWPLVIDRPRLADESVPLVTTAGKIKVVKAITMVENISEMKPRIVS